RGVKESVVALAPIVAFFVASHLLVLVVAIGHRIGDLPGAVAAVPADAQRLAAHHGAVGLLGLMIRAYALGGAIYTGLESISNGVPILREPKVRFARRTMLLLAGIPGVLIALILAGYFLYDVRPEAERTVNAVLFERAFSDLGVHGAAWRALMV